MQEHLVHRKPSKGKISNFQFSIVKPCERSCNGQFLCKWVINRSLGGWNSGKCKTWKDAKVAKYVKRAKKQECEKTKWESKGFGWLETKKVVSLTIGKVI